MQFRHYAVKIDFQSSHLLVPFRWLFWGIGGDSARIMSARLDGSDIGTLVKYSELTLTEDGNSTHDRDGYPIAMVIDYQLNRLYWVDHSLNSLFSIALVGRSVACVCVCVCVCSTFYMYIIVYLCVSVCVCEREIEMEREKEQFAKVMLYMKLLVAYKMY